MTTGSKHSKNMSEQLNLKFYFFESCDENGLKVFTLKVLIVLLCFLVGLVAIQHYRRSR